MAADFLGSLLVKIDSDSSGLNTGIKSAETSLTKLTTSANKAGSALTKSLTLPLTLVGGLALKAASDLGESTNAINVVFGDSAKIITDWGETADKSAGLSKSAVNDAAVVIGSSLKNAGIETEKVAGLTVDLAQRASDMASIFNTDVDQALTAIQAGLRGEADPLERFGVGLSAAKVNAKALELGLADTVKELDDTDKATARVALIFEQTEPLAGDFANTVDQAANATRALKARAENVAAEFGENLLPIFADAVDFAAGLVDSFSELSDSDKEFVVQLGLTAAGIGPVIKAVGLLGTAFTFLAANPIVAVIAGIGAITIGLVHMAKKAGEIRQAELSETFGAIAENAGIAAEETAEFLEKAGGIEDALSRGFGQSAEDLVYQIQQLSENLGVSEATVIEIGLASENLTDTLKDQLSEIKSQNTELLIQNELSKDGGIINESILLKKQRQLSMARDMVTAAAELTENQKRNREATEEILKIDQLRASGAFTEEEALKQYIEIREGLIETIQNEALASGEATQEQINSIAFFREKIDANEERLEEIREARKEDVETQKTEIEDLAEVERVAIEESDITRLNAIDSQLSAETSLGEIQAAQHQARLTEKAAEIAKTKELQASYEAMGASIANVVGPVLSQTAEAIANGEDAWDIFKEAAKGAIASAVEALGQQYAIQAAAALVPIPGIFNPAGAAGAAAVSAGAYVAAGVIRAFEDGGIVTGPTNALIGEGSDNEAVIPLNQTTLAGIGAGIAQASGSTVNNSNSNQTININSTFTSASPSELRRMARELRPYLVNENSRLGAASV